MRMYFNEDFKSHNAEVNEIIHDLNKNRTESYDRGNTKKRAEAMQAENKKFDELKELLNKHKGDFSKIDEAIKLSKTDPKKAKEILLSLGIPEEEIAAHIKEVKDKTFLERLKNVIKVFLN